MRPSLTGSMTRRQALRASGIMAGAALLPAYAFPSPQSAAPDRSAAIAQVAKMRAMAGATPIAAAKLTDSVSLLSGPGGNVVVVHGADGKLAVDGFVQPAWPALKKILDDLGPAPIRMLIDTHWHFDHADNNANFRAAGAAVVACDNTKTRLAEPHEVLGMYFEPAPASALPTQTFPKSTTVTINRESLTLTLVPPAHTDTDVLVLLTKANVLHMGDVFFNGMYPFIDASTGGHIDGMIAGATRAIQMVDANTRIVPGHGPIGDRAALVRYRDALAEIRERVHKLKAAGQPLAEVQAAKPTSAFDAAFAKGMLAPDAFVALVYGTLK